MAEECRAGVAEIVVRVIVGVEVGTGVGLLILDTFISSWCGG